MSLGNKALSILLVHHLSIMVINISQSLLFWAPPPNYREIKRGGEKCLLERLFLSI